MDADRPVAEAVRPLARRLDLEAAMEAYAAHRWTGESRGLPILHVDDVSGIPFVQEVLGVEEYQHRARVRARSGDLFVAVTPQSDGYEEYCRSVLDLGMPEFVLADGGEHDYAVARASLVGRGFDRLVARARAAGGLWIHPYMAIETVWELAARVAAEAGVSVQVIGPPPPVLWVANDKAALSEIVTRVLSPKWIVESLATTVPAVMAQQLVRLSARNDRVGLKRARCASGLGNGVFDGAYIRKMSPHEVSVLVDGFLERTEWPGDEQVVVVAWEDAACSPSTQTWIPPEGKGPPVVEGVYEQVLEGDNGVFVGSRPTTLPQPVNRALAKASMAVATAFQALGYVGRCSFDFVLVGDPESEFRVKFTECNGRWGGTSTPMHLVDRVLGRPRPPYWAQDYMHQGLVGVSFPEVIDRVGGARFEPATGTGNYIFYNVGPLARSGKLDVVALADTPQRAEELVREDLPRRLGLR